MPDSVTIKVDGLDTIERALTGLPLAMRERILKDALDAGAEVLRAGIADKIHSRTGRTAADLKVATKVENTAGLSVVGAGSGRKSGRGFVLNFLEHGTKPHVEPKKRKGPRISVTFGARTLTRRGPAAASPKMAFGGKVYSGVKHPGTHAQAPMRRTIAEQGIASVKAFTETAWAGIRDAVQAH